MSRNVGGIDRALRIVIGLALLSLLFVLEGGTRWLGLLGVPLLVSGLFGTCGAYSLLGISTCPLKAGQR